MNILKKYSISYNNIQDDLVVFSPTSISEKREMFRFRYLKYLEHGYIDFENSKLDIDLYDNTDTFYINVWSVKQERIIGTVRIIFAQPLPIFKDCFDFDEPFLAKIICNEQKAEIGRLIIDKYKQDLYLPSHFILMILIKEVLIITKKMNIKLVYSFVKLSLFNKLKNMYFPFFKIKKYTKKYKKGTLLKYFNQKDSPVVPIYFIRFVVNLYVFFAWFKFRKYICQ